MRAFFLVHSPIKNFYDRAEALRSKPNARSCMITVCVDAMGGDSGPEQVLQGIRLALQKRS